LLQAHLDIPHSQQVTLNNPDLNSPSGLQNAILAAKSLQRAMNAELKPGIKHFLPLNEIYLCSYFFIVTFKD
jgi:hypothetical protein